MAKKAKTPASKVKKIVLWAILLIILMSVVFVALIAKDLDVTFGDSMGTLDLKLTSIVYSHNKKTDEWEEYEYLSSEGKRIWADIDDIPNYLEDAFIAIEDQRFMSHHGVDWKRTFGAVFNEIFKGGSEYGGSSITQQLVKNLTGERDRKYTRKIKEIVRALVLESKMSKQQIMELYLNSIYLGQGCNGVEAAAQIYFNKAVSELSIAESASIAGITQYPSLYDPFANPDKNIEKQRTVLYKMFELGFITREDYDEAVAEELNFIKGESFNSNQSYFVDQVVEDLIVDLCDEYGYSEAFATQLIYNGGFKIYATVDRNAQEYAESVFESEDCIPRVGGDEQPQAAMVATEPETGHVKIIVGGRGEKVLSRGLNRATQTTRQPGSSIKPLSVYAPALDLGLITTDSIISDQPINIGGWTPKNYGGTFSGQMTVRQAVSKSANIPAVEVLQKVTVEKSFDYMTNKLNFSTLVDSEKRDGVVYTDKNLASLALGGLTDGVTVLEMSAAYATFANQGEYIEPITYTKVTDNVGKTVLEKEQRTNRAFKPTTAFLANQLLAEVVTSGTAGGSNIYGMSTGGKTGTTDKDADRWFVGYTPYYSTAVWVGMDSSKHLPVFSYNPALSIWKKVMTKIHSGLAGRSFVRPDGMVPAEVCYVTDLLATENCFDDEGNSSVATRYYDKTNVPKRYCGGDHGKTPEEVALETEENPEEGVEGELSEDVESDSVQAPSVGGGGQTHTTTQNPDNAIIIIPNTQAPNVNSGISTIVPITPPSERTDVRGGVTSSDNSSGTNVRVNTRGGSSTIVIEQGTPTETNTIQ